MNGYPNFVLLLPIIRKFSSTVISIIFADFDRTIRGHLSK